MSLGKLNNVATFYLAPSYNKLTAFCAEARLDDIDQSDPLCHNNIISNKNRDSNEFDYNHR